MILCSNRILISPTFTHHAFLQMMSECLRLAYVFYPVGHPVNTSGKNGLQIRRPYIHRCKQSQKSLFFLAVFFSSTPVFKLFSLMYMPTSPLVIFLFPLPLASGSSALASLQLVRYVLFAIATFAIATVFI